MIYLDLFLGFLRVGLFSFGGAYAAIPLIRDVVLSYGWLTDEALSYMIAVSESTPGPIMVNLATYVGSSQGGLLGAVIATVTVVLPAFVIILLVMLILRRFLGNPVVKAVMRGLVPCIIGIIGATGLYMLLGCCFGTGLSAPDLRSILLAVVLGLICIGTKRIMKKKISPILLIGIAAVLGAAVFAF